MLKARLVTVWFTAGLMAFGVGTVSGQAYPSKPIRLWSGNAGSGSDFFARQIAQAIAGPLGQPVIVENRPPIASAEVVSKAPPDGYNLMYGGSTLMYTPLLVKTSYDPIRDFS